MRGENSARKVFGCVLLKKKSLKNKNQRGTFPATENHSEMLKSSVHQNFRAFRLLYDFHP